MLSYHKVERIIAQKGFYVLDALTGKRKLQWDVVKVESLGDLSREFTWRTHFPLILNVYGKSKMGVAKSPYQLAGLLEKLGEKTDMPYEVEKQMVENPAPKVNAPRHNWLKELEKHAR